MKAKLSYQTVDARIEPLNSPRTLAFSVFCNAVTNDMRFIKLSYRYICMIYIYICIYIWARGLKLSHVN